MVMSYLMRLAWGSRICIIKHWLPDNVFSLCVFVILIVPLRFWIGRRSRLASPLSSLPYFEWSIFLVRLSNNPQALRSIFYQVIISHPTHGLGAETDFAFKYVPQFDTTTTTEHEAEAVSSALARLKVGGVERRNLKALIYAGVGLSVVSFVGVKIGLLILGGVRRLLF